MIEEWKDIPGYEGHYQANPNGEIRSVTKHVGSKSGSIATKHGKVLTQTTINKGYKQVHLSKNGTAKNESVHRLIASTFIDNPNGYPCINHIDENPGNNLADNLEWCSYKYNNDYGTRKEKYHKSRINGKMSKAILQYDLNGNLIAEYPSCAEINRSLGFDQSHVISVAKGKPRYNTAYGYVWRYKDDPINHN